MAKAPKPSARSPATTPSTPRLILGSGLSAIGELLTDKVTIPFSELKGFPRGGVSGHGRDLLIGQMGGKRIAILTGREHYYEHGNAAAMRPALETHGRARRQDAAADQFGRLARPRRPRRAI